MKKKLVVLGGFVMGLVPLAVFAQSSNVQGTCNGVGAVGQGTIETVICRIGSILNTIIPFLIVLGVVYFIWGVISYVIGGDEEAKAAGRSKMIMGIIGLVVVVGVWGLVAIVTKTFGLNGTYSPAIPCVIGTPGCS